jgi:NAD(P)-dependent dehydrogenase (short-subunit alcohol dehydrogenase family)
VARILITGSTDGLGRDAAGKLIALGHDVVIHGRNEARTADGLAALPRASGAVTGDFASMAGTRALAAQIDALEPFDVIVHNAGIGYSEERRIETEDGLAHVFQINVVGPYLLTALVRPPTRLVYLSSGIHRDGSPDLSDLQWERREWNGYLAYCDSKLLDTALAAAVARLLPSVTTVSLEPGWVKTKMGGPDAPGEVGSGGDNIVWIVAGDDPSVTSGCHFDGREPSEPHPAVSDRAVQDGLLAECRRLTGVELRG